MPRTVSAKIGGKSVKLKATFEAGQEICEDICDLLIMQREQATALLFMQRGMPYTPKFAFTIKHVVDILAIAVKHSDTKLTREDVEAFTIDEGIDKAQAVATQYLQLFFAEPETKPEPDEKAKSEPGK